MPLDEADKKFLADGITAALKSHADTQADVVGKIVAESLKPVIARMDATDAKVKDATEKAEKAGKQPETDPAKKAKDDKSTDPATAKLQEQVDNLTASLKAAEDEKKAAADKAKIDALVNHAREALAEAGVPPDRMKIALAAIKDEGILAYDGDRAGFKYQRKGYTEVVSGKPAAEEWLKTDAGKLFLPATGQEGDGRRGGKAPNQERAAGTPIDQATLERKLGQLAFG